jgi:hypothetical protein
VRASEQGPVSPVPEPEQASQVQALRGPEPASQAQPVRVQERPPVWLRVQEPAPVRARGLPSGLFRVPKPV